MSAPADRQWVGTVDGKAFYTTDPGMVGAIAWDTSGQPHEYALVPAWRPPAEEPEDGQDCCLAVVYPGSSRLPAAHYVLHWSAYATARPSIGAPAMFYIHGQAPIPLTDHGYCATDSDGNVFRRVVAWAPEIVREFPEAMLP